MEPIFNRIGSYFIIWIVILELQHFVSIDLSFPYVVAPVISVLIISHLFPYLRVFSRRQYFNEKDKIKHRECFLNNVVVQYEIVHTANHAIGERYLLKPALNRRGRRLFTFFMLAICSGTVLVLNISQAPLVDMKIVLVAISIDFLVTWIWYCTTWADELALITADSSGVRVGSPLKLQTRKYQWKDVSVSAHDISENLKRTTILTPTRSYTVIITKKTLMMIAYFMSADRESS